MSSAESTINSLLKTIEELGKENEKLKSEKKELELQLDYAQEKIISLERQLEKIYGEPESLKIDRWSR